MSSSRRGSSRRPVAGSSRHGGTGGGPAAPAEDVFQTAWLNRALADAKDLKRFRKLEIEFSDTLINHFRGELESPERQQALFALLGSGYVVKNFPHHKYELNYLEKLSPAEKAKVLEEMKAFIDEKVSLNLESFKKSHGIEEKLTRDIRKAFVEEFHNTIQKQLVEANKIKVRKGRKGRIKIKELEDTLEDRKEFVFTALIDMFGTKNGVEDLAIKKLYSKVLILPPEIRYQIYLRLFWKRSPEETREARKDFETALRAKLREEGIKNVSDWEGRRVVDSSVILAYERSQVLKEELEVHYQQDDGEHVDDRLVFYTRILSICKLCFDNFSPTHIFWLVRAAKYFPPAPMMVGDDSNYAGGSFFKHDKAIRVAMHFQTFSKMAVFPNDMIFSLAGEVYSVLEQHETRLLSKLYQDMKDGLETVDPTLFSQDIILQDEDRRNELWKHFLMDRRLNPGDLEHFHDIRLYFRKWLSEAFTGSLSRNGIALIWDFLSIHSFSENSAINVCLALFHLLVPMLQSANTFRKVQRILMEGPKMLFIKDIRRALRHLTHHNADYAHIPGAPQVPRIDIIPPSAGKDRKALRRRIEALNMDFVTGEETVREESETEEESEVEDLEDEDDDEEDSEEDTDENSEEDSS